MQQLRPAPEPDPGRGQGHRAAALLYFAAVPGHLTTGSGFRIYLSDLGGAKEIRTPDLLHAMQVKQAACQRLSGVYLRF
jgi:hypothetical protein